MEVRRFEPSARERFAQLDGLRGVAALVVVIYHFFCAFIPQLVPDVSPQSRFIAHTPLYVFWNGSFAVSVFFVLSGFVIYKSATDRFEPLRVRVPLRYLRLAVPATVSSVYGWVLLKAFPSASEKLPHVPVNGWLSATYHGHIPSLWRALFEGSVQAFVQGENRFNNVLWTMQPEIIGSIGIYILVRAVPDRWRLRALALIAFGVALAGQGLFEGFVLGAVLRHLQANRRLRLRFSGWVFALGVLVGSASFGAATRLHLPPASTFLTLGARQSVFYPLAAALVVCATVLSAGLTRFFTSAPCQWLGRTSFALYLFHVPLLYTVFATAFFNIPMVHAVQKALFLLAFLLTAVSIGYIGTFSLDEPLQAFLATMKRAARERRSLN